VARPNESVTIAGRATTSTGQMQSRAFEIAVQDSSGGIRVFSRALEVEVREGDSVVATGTIKRYRGDLELVATRVIVVPSARRVAPPREVPLDVSVIARFPGQLVRVHGRVDGFGYSEGGQWLRLRDSAAARGTITIWVPANHGAPVDLSKVGADDSLSVAGIVTRYQDNADDPVVWQLVPRTKDDVVISSTTATWSRRLLWSLIGAAAVILGGAAFARLNSRRHLRALRETDARYRQLLAMSPEAVLVHADGKIMFTNPAAAELLGMTSEAALVGRAIGDYAAPESRDALDGLATDTQGGRSPRVRGRLIKSTGAALDVEISSSPCVYHDQPAVVVLARDISAQLRHERDLHALALVDELTGLHNRRGFTLFADQEIARARRSGRVPTLVFADLDDLKVINDAYGHASGDVAIRVVAAALKSILREADIVARWSGDEFVALLTDSDPTEAEQIGSRLASAIASQNPDLPYAVSATVGTSALDPVLSLRDAIERADAELYTRKKRARGARATAVAEVDAGSERQ
jgi:diguanylate cyclase (GGDEF)-like protein/PAS domain S-box-containing protein